MSGQTREQTPMERWLEDRWRAFCYWWDEWASLLIGLGVLLIFLCVLAGACSAYSTYADQRLQQGIVEVKAILANPTGNPQVDDERLRKALMRVRGSDE